MATENHKRIGSPMRTVSVKQARIERHEFVREFLHIRCSQDLQRVIDWANENDADIKFFPAPEAN